MTDELYDELLKILGYMEDGRIWIARETLELILGVQEEE